MICKEGELKGGEHVALTRTTWRRHLAHDHVFALLSLEARAVDVFAREAREFGRVTHELLRRNQLIESLAEEPHLVEGHALQRSEVRLVVTTTVRGHLVAVALEEERETESDAEQKLFSFDQ